MCHECPCLPEIQMRMLLMAVRHLQIGKAVGAHVIAVARGRDKCAVLEGLGADLVIDSAALKEPLRIAIKSVAPKGMHAVSGDNYSLSRSQNPCLIR